MADPTIVLLIVVGLTAAERPHASIVSSAVSSALGTSARVLVEERGTSPTDAEAATTSERLGGSAIAEIAWVSSAHVRAHMRVYLDSDHTWYDQELSFDTLDAPEDRERSIGLLVGAMIRSRQSDAPATSAEVPPAPAPPRALETAPANVAATLVAPPTTDRPPPANNVASRRMRLGFDVGGLGMTGIGGEAPGLGASVRARLVFTPALSIDGGAGLGFGSLSGAGAQMTTTRIVLGGRWVFARVTRTNIAFDVGLEGVVVHHDVRRSAPDASRDRWLSGGHVDVGAGWPLTSALELYAMVGTDVVLGTTPITVAGERVTSIPPVRGVLEAGARFFF